MIRNLSSIDQRFRTVTITFKPEVRVAENDTVAILGEFNSYMPENMERFESEEVLLNPELDNTFFYKTRLLTGFKYRYYFSVGEQFTVDISKPVSEDRLGRGTNFVEVASKEDEE